MPDIIGDAALYENPLDAAAQTYAQTPPAEGAIGAMGAEIGQTPILGYAARALERGQFAGAGGFDRWLAQSADAMAAEGGTMVPPAPIETPTISPEAANALAPEGTTITDKPIPQGLAEVLARQKADQQRRDSVLSRYSGAHPFGAFASETLASFADPLNLSTLVLPAYTGEALAARLGGGILARTGARLGAGAVTGAAQQVPLSAVRFGLSQDEFDDYSLHDAFRDIAFGAAGGAIINAGIVGPIRDVLRWHRGEAALPAGTRPDIAEAAAPILGADTATDHAAMAATVGEILDGRPAETAEFIYQPPQTATALGSTVPVPEGGSVGRAPGADQINTLARRLDPEVFAEWDRLNGVVEQARGQLAAGGARPEDHPDIAAIDQQLDSLRQQRSEARARRDRASLANDIAGLEDRRADAVAALPSAEQTAATMQQDLAQADYAKRDLAVKISAASREAERQLGQGQAMSPRPVPTITDAILAAEDALRGQRLLNREGWAPGISGSDLRQAIATVYEPVANGEPGAAPAPQGMAMPAPRAHPSRRGRQREEPIAPEAAAEPAREGEPPPATAPAETGGIARPAPPQATAPRGFTTAKEKPGGLFGKSERTEPGLIDRELAEAETAAARLDTARLLPEERAEIAATAQGLTDASEIAAGLSEAAACIGGAFGGA